MHQRILLSIWCLMMLAAAVTFAETPNHIAYQGQLVDASGEPVADGLYQMRFRIYDDSVAGTWLWDSDVRQVSVVGGLFHYSLGDSVALGTFLFNSPERYLGITVGSDPEMTPRTPFSKVAYADRVQTLHGAQGGVLNAGGSETIEVRTDASDQYYAYTVIEQKTSGMTRIRSSAAVNGPWAGTGYYAEEESIEAWIGAFDGGELGLWGGASAILFDATVSGDSSVDLPASAVGSQELLDEPGIANTLHSAVFVYLDTVGIYVIDSVTINAPTGGWVELTGGCFANLHHLAGYPVTCMVQVSDVQGYEGWWLPGSQVSGISTGMAAGGCLTLPVTSTRIMPVTVGQHTFYFKAHLYESGGTTMNVADVYLRAKFYPTMYGDVDVTTSESTSPVAAASEIPPDGSLQITTEVQTITLEQHTRLVRQALEAQQRRFESRLLRLEEGLGIDSTRVEK